METQYNSSSTPVNVENGGTAYANKRKLGGWNFVLRVLALALSLTAAVLVGINKQTTLVTMKILTELPPVKVPVTAKTQNFSAFTYFVAANAIASAYAAISLVLSLAHGGRKKVISALVVFSDLTMVALLYSAVGAASAIGLLGYQGNSHVRWNKVCNHFGKFCAQSAAAVAISNVSSIAFFVLVLFNVNKTG